MNSTEIFIKKAKLVHGNKYDYSKVEYVNNKTKVCIICHEHGEFWQQPNNHLHGQGCPKCGQEYNIKRNKDAKENFIEKAKSIHGNKYDYSKVEYVNNKTKVCIICLEHGEFWQRPDAHLFKKHGCPYCGGTKRRTTEEFIEKSKEIFGDKYDYSKTEYLNDRSPVCLIEQETGNEIWQNPKSHLNGYGHISTSSRKRLTTIEFISKAKNIHGDKYDYSKVKYKNFETKVCIICPEHGEFWQTPHTHLIGDGCPFCKTSKLEKEIIDLLDEEHIKYEYQKKFDWLKNKNKMSIDFFLPEKNVVIECQGRQHFRKEEFFGGDVGYTTLVERDKLKKKLCNEHDIKVLYYSDFHHDYWDKVFYDKDELLNEIKNGTDIL